MNILRKYLFFFFLLYFHIIFKFSLFVSIKNKNSLHPKTLSLDISIFLLKNTSFEDFKINFLMRI